MLVDTTNFDNLSVVTSSVYSLRRYFMWPILMHKIEKKKFIAAWELKPGLEFGCLYVFS